MQKWKIKGLKIRWELERFTDIKEPKELQRNLNVYKWIGNMEVKDLQQIKNVEIEEPLLFQIIWGTFGVSWFP